MNELATTRRGGLPLVVAALVLLSGFILLSGATGLAYEVIWFRRLGYLWGNSSLAAAAVVSSFLGGLALGAWLMGRVAERVRHPLAWYGACEVAIGLLALLVPFELAWLGAIPPPRPRKAASRSCRLRLALR